MKPSQQDFYVGYRPQAPPALAAWLRKYWVMLVILPALVAVLFVLTQNTFAPATFEFGEVREFEGQIAEFPYPTLVLTRPGEASEEPRSRYYLVQFGKYGAAEAVAGLHGQKVRLQGTLIYRDDQTMIELAPGEIEVLGSSEILEPSSSPSKTVTLEGEIVDSKCFLGVMNPGSAKTHKACATRCIAGGIPPLLLERTEAGARYYLLTGPGGEAINQEVLGWVAEPVRVSGALRRLDNLDVLEIDPAAIESIEN